MAHLGKKAAAKGKKPQSSTPTQRRDQGEAGAAQRKPKVFEWKFSDELSAVQMHTGGKILYNNTFLSTIYTDSPYGHWGGWEGEQDALALVRTQATPVPPERAKCYLALDPLSSNLDIKEDGMRLMTLTIETLVLTVDLFSEAFMVRLQDKVTPHVRLLSFLPRLLWEPLLADHMRTPMLEIFRIPFYANLYDVLDYTHPLIPKAPMLAKILSEASTSNAGAYRGVPIEVMREIMCRLTPNELASFSRASKWTYRIASDDDVWCWQCATRLNLSVLPTLMKAVCMEYRRLWILLNNSISFTFERANTRPKFGQPYSSFVVDMHIGPMREIRRSPFPNRQFSPDRSKD